MVSLNEITYDIFETLRGQIVDDDNIDKRQIEGFIKDYRADFLKQRYEKDFFKIDENSTQELLNLPVEKVNSSTLSDYSNEGSFMKTVSTIPELVRGKGTNTLIAHIGVPNRLSLSFEITDYQTAISSGYGRFNRNEIFAFPLNGYMYFYSKGDDMKLIFNINLRGIFTDPYEVIILNSPSTIITGDENFYTPRDLKRYIVNSILKDKYNLIVNAPSDNTNDSTHNLEE